MRDNPNKMFIFVFKNWNIMHVTYSGFAQSEEMQREELIRKIEASVKGMSLRELEALYYDMTTKSYINDIWTICFFNLNDNKNEEDF